MRSWMKYGRKQTAQTIIIVCDSWVPYCKSMLRPKCAHCVSLAVFIFVEKGLRYVHKFLWRHLKWPWLQIEGRGLRYGTCVGSENISTYISSNLSETFWLSFIPLTDRETNRRLPSRDLSRWWKLAVCLHQGLFSTRTGGWISSGQRLTVAGLMTDNHITFSSKGVPRGLGVIPTD